MKSRVHPKYKTKYHVQNWASYERALVRRGNVTVWLSPEAIAAWEPDGGGTRGGQRKYSDVAIETALTLRLIFHLPLRQAEGFLISVFGLMGVDLPSPDHTTLSRRGQHLDVTLRRPPRGDGLHLIIDSTGLSMFGEGEWAAAKHGGHGTRGWKKLHLGVDRSGVIVAQALTDATVDDAVTGTDLIGAVDGDVASVTADAAYDTIAFYNSAKQRGAKVVVPPVKTARLSRRRPRSSARDRTIRKVTQLGRRRWKKEAVSSRGRCNAAMITPRRGHAPCASCTYVGDGNRSGLGPLAAGRVHQRDRSCDGPEPRVDLLPACHPRWDLAGPSDAVMACAHAA